MRVKRSDESRTSESSRSPIASSVAPKLAELRVRAVRVPMAEPHQTASGTVGESPLVNWSGAPDFTHAVEAHASDYVMPDVMKIDVAGTLGTGVAWNEAAVRKLAV